MITPLFRSQNLVSRVGTKIWTPSHPPCSRMSIHGLGYPDHLLVLTPRRVYDTLAHSARGEIPGQTRFLFLVPALDALEQFDTLLTHQIPKS